MSRARVAAEVRPIQGRGSVPLAAGMALVAATGSLTWWLIGSQTAGDDYLFGPFDLASWVEPAAVAVIGVVLVWGVVTVAVPALRRRPRLATVSTVLLMVVVGVAAAGWRVMTAGVIGANIGGGMVVLFGPPLLAVLLAGVAWAETKRRGLDRGRRLVWVVSAVVAVAGFQVVLWHLAAS